MPFNRIIKVCVCIYEQAVKVDNVFVLVPISENIVAVNVYFLDARYSHYCSLLHIPPRPTIRKEALLFCET